MTGALGRPVPAGADAAGNTPPAAKAAHRAPHPHRPKRRWGDRVRRWAPLVVILVGIGILLYPVLATQRNNDAQRAFSAKYNGQVQHTPPHELAADLASARRYNARITGIPILDPWLDKADGDPGSTAHRDYAHQLSRFDAMARIRFPRLGIDLPVYHDTTDLVLAKGVGHLYGTSLPVGGANTHAVLTSHTGMNDRTLFDHLHSAKVGDVFFVDVSGEHLAYQVDRLKVVLPTQLRDLRRVTGKDNITLVTCTPYSVNTHRLLVRAHRVPYAEAAAHAPAQQSGFVMEPWMRWLIGLAGLSLILLIFLLWRLRRRQPTMSPRGSR